MDIVFQELLSVNFQQTHDFFRENLKDVIGNTPLKTRELTYVANILAHYAQSSPYDTNFLPLEKNLSAIFEKIIVLETSDYSIMEAYASQILLLAGFFRDQMCHRHNVAWYDTQGQLLYQRASLYSRDGARRSFFDGLSESLPRWNRACRDLSRELRRNQENYLLLRL
jgi:hypothetical protein